MYSYMLVSQVRNLSDREAETFAPTEINRSHIILRQRMAASYMGVLRGHEGDKGLAHTLDPWGCKITYDGKEYTWSIVGIKDGEDGATH